jgi:predicted Zn finger-like uncharacterized protein
VNVSCPECRSVFRVDPTKIPAIGVRARCSVCGGVIILGAGSSIEEEFAPAAAPIVAARAPARAAASATIPEPVLEPLPVAAKTSPRVPDEPPAREFATPAAGAPPTPPTPRRPLTPPRPAPTVVRPVSAAPLRPPAFAPRVPPAASPAVRQSAAGGTPSRPPLAQMPAGFPPRPVAPPAAGAAAPAARVGVPAARVAVPEGRDAVPEPPPPRPASPTPSRLPINPFLANDPNAKARRLSRALISDLVTYFPQRREEGLRQGTLRELFRDEIKKSYEEYVEQVGKDFAESTTHFQEALNEILAGGQRLF